MDIFSWCVNYVQPPTILIQASHFKSLKIIVAVILLHKQSFCCRLPTILLDPHQSQITASMALIKPLFEGVDNELFVRSLYIAISV